MSSWRCISAGENGNIPWWGADQPYHLCVNVAIMEKAVAIWAVMALKASKLKEKDLFHRIMWAGLLFCLACPLLTSEGTRLPRVVAFLIHLAGSSVSALHSRHRCLSNPDLFYLQRFQDHAIQTQTETIFLKTQRVTWALHRFQTLKMIYSWLTCKWDVKISYTCHVSNITWRYIFLNLATQLVSVFQI